MGRTRIQAAIQALGRTRIQAAIQLLGRIRIQAAIQTLEKIRNPRIILERKIPGRRQNLPTHQIQSSTISISPIGQGQISSR